MKKDTLVHIWFIFKNKVMKLYTNEHLISFFPNSTDLGLKTYSTRRHQDHKKLQGAKEGQHSCRTKKKEKLSETKVLTAQN